MVAWGTSVAPPFEVSRVYRPLWPKRALPNPINIQLKVGAWSGGPLRLLVWNINLSDHSRTWSSSSRRRRTRWRRRTTSWGKFRCRIWRGWRRNFRTFSSVTGRGQDTSTHGQSRPISKWTTFLQQVMIGDPKKSIGRGKSYQVKIIAPIEWRWE